MPTLLLINASTIKREGCEPGHAVRVPHPSRTPLADIVAEAIRDGKLAVEPGDVALAVDDLDGTSWALRIGKSDPPPPPLTVQFMDSTPAVV